MAALWSIEEDEVLSEYWPKGGIEQCRPVLPNRSDRAIKTRAYERGLRITDNRLSTHRNRWTDDEIAFLRQHYPTRGIDYCRKALPERTSASVRIKVAVLGLKLDADTMAEIRRNQGLARRKEGATVIDTAARALSMRW